MWCGNTTNMRLETTNRASYRSELQLQNTPCHPPFPKPWKKQSKQCRTLSTSIVVWLCLQVIGITIWKYHAGMAIVNIIRLGPRPKRTPIVQLKIDINIPTAPSKWLIHLQNDFTTTSKWLSNTSNRLYSTLKAPLHYLQSDVQATL